MGATTLIGLTVLSGALSYQNSQRQASAVRREGRYISAVNTANAALADESAEDAIARGWLAEQRLRTGTHGLAAEQRTMLAAQGLDLSTGSAAEIAENTIALGELDALMIRNNAAREAWGYRVEATNFRQQALLARSSSKAQARSLRMQGVSTLLTTAAQSADIYDRSK